MKNSNKLAMLDKLKNTMQSVEYHSTFNFESYEIDEETKKFIEKKEELISNSFMKYSSSKYDICMALIDVKMKFRDKDSSFMAWYTHIGFTKDKVSELLKTYELYIQAPHMKDFISSLSGVAVRLLTHKDVSPQLAVDIMEKGVKNMDDIRELIELALSPVVPSKVVEYKGNISKKSLGAIKNIQRKIKKSTSATELSSAKKEIEAMKKVLLDMEKDIAAKEKEYENKNNLSLLDVLAEDDYEKYSFINLKGNVFFIKLDTVGNYGIYVAFKDTDIDRSLAKPLDLYFDTEEEACAALIKYAKDNKLDPLEAR